MLRINEIFYSLQMEGTNTGTAAVFVRLADCNLACPFCDTDFSEKMQLSEEDVLEQVQIYDQCSTIVLTGGEPLAQDVEPLVTLLHDEGYKIFLETNGTFNTELDFDWITMSPKSEILLREWDEAKLVILKDETRDNLIARYEELKRICKTQIYLQPCWYPDDPIGTAEATKRAVEFVKIFPIFKLSLQGHKLIGIR